MATETLERLLELQAHDLELDRLAHRRRGLPERAEVEQLRGAQAAKDAEARRLRSARDDLVARQRAIDAEVDATRRRIAAIGARLRAGAASSFRDQQAMGEEQAALERRQRELEDRELEVMEELEALDADLSRVEAELAGLAQDLEGAVARLGAAEAAIEGEEAAVRARRGPIADAVDPGLLADYERLRRRHGGVGVARLVGGSCGGCHLALPASELDQARHAAPGSIVHCEQCGRILVP